MSEGAGSTKTFDLITSAYRDLEGFSELRDLALVLVVGGLIVCECYELYKFTRGEKADFLAPVLKVIVAVVLIISLVPLVGWISRTMYMASTAVFKENLIEAANEAISSVFRGVTDPGLLDYVKVIFSPTAWVSMILFFSIMTMLVIKMLIIDFVWPVMLGLVVLGGVFSIPIGLFPGMGTFKGWVVSVLEVSIWPLVFQITTALLFAVVQGQLAEVKNLDGVWETVDKIGELEALASSGKLTKGSEEEVKKVVELQRIKLLVEHGIDAKKVDGVIFTLFKFLAINIAFLAFCIFTPFLSRMIVRSESAGTIGSMIVGGATTVAAMATSKLKDMGRRK